MISSDFTNKDDFEAESQFYFVCACYDSIEITVNERINVLGAVTEVKRFN